MLMPIFRAKKLETRISDTRNISWKTIFWKKLFKVSAVTLSGRDSLFWCYVALLFKFYKDELTLITFIELFIEMIDASAFFRNSYCLRDWQQFIRFMKSTTWKKQQWTNRYLFQIFWAIQDNFLMLKQISHCFFHFSWQ